MKLCLLNLLILIVFCVILTLTIFFTLLEPWNHIFIRKIWGNFTSLNIRNFDISKFQKSELGKFVPNFPLKHVITSTNIALNFSLFKAVF